MKSGAEIIAPLKNWFLALNKRERIMVGGATILVLAYLLLVLMLMPALNKYRTLEKRLQTQQQDNTELSQQISELGTALQDSPNNRQRQEVKRLEQQLRALHAEVQAHLDALIAPEQMPAILRRLLQHHPGLTLLSMQNAPAQAVRPLLSTDAEEQGSNLSATENGQKEQAGHLYRQPLILKLEGSYLDILAYVEKISAWPEHMFIDAIYIRMEEYPRNEITLQVSSVSTAPSLLRGISTSGATL